MSNFVLAVVCLLTLIINFIGIVSLSARIVGTRTKRIASSFSLFNIISLVAQFSNTIQAPLLAKSVEKNILLNQEPNLTDFRQIILFATFGSILGGLAIPTMQRFMKKGVDSLYLRRSIFKVIIHSFKLRTITFFIESIKIPSTNNLKNLKNYQDIPKGMLLLNVFIYCFTTINVLTCLYAGYLNADLRATALSMTGFSVAIGSIAMLIFVEPYNATLTDKVIDGSVSEAYFRKYLMFIIIARIIGTFLSQFFLIPMAHIIIKISEWLYV